MILFLLITGLLLLVVGGELLVRGAVAIAEWLRVSPLLIGLTLVGFGTSTPELVTSLQAALEGSPGISVGNVVGSNIANILLILGISALIFPIAVSKAAFRRDGVVLALAAFMCLGAVLFGELGRIIGSVLVMFLIAYILFAFTQERQTLVAVSTKPTLTTPNKHIWLQFLLLFAGLALTILGARLLVSSAIDIAARLQVPDTIVGLTIVAVGTSLPELVTSLMAAFRKQGDLAFGNIVGSNIYNIFGILGVTALVKPISVPPQIAHFDIWVMCGATALLVIVTMTRWRITRAEGGLMLLGYAAYLGWLGFVAAN